MCAGLNAVGYGAKETGTSCFMTPNTFRLISRLREEGLKRGLGVDNITPVASLTWTDSAGKHATDDLLINPPVVA